MNKNRFVNFILTLMLFVGLFLLLYPSFSDYFNSLTASRAISAYTQHVSEIDEEEYEQILENVREYNQSLLERANPYMLDKYQEEQYFKLLNFGDNSSMGYVEIPSIGCSIPIYHTTEEKVLQKAVGHLSWSSLPLGGEGTHCVLSGHRGLPSAKLFTNIDKMREGDIFKLSILNETLTYQVDKILTVSPKETKELLIDPDKDYCTLVTCTPYGINTHRLFIRGERIDANKKNVRVISEATRIEPIIVAPICSIPILLLLLICLYLPKPKKISDRGDNDEAFM